MRTTPLPSLECSVPVMRGLVRVSSVMSCSSLFLGGLRCAGHSCAPPSVSGGGPAIPRVRRAARGAGCTAKLPVLAHLDQTGITQDSQVSRDARPSDRQQLRQLTDRGPSCAWQAHDRNAEKRVTTE